MQRRSEAKKIGPGLWDISVAEHLNRGEEYRPAAIRGLGALRVTIHDVTITITKIHIHIHIAIAFALIS